MPSQTPTIARLSRAVAAFAVAAAGFLLAPAALAVEPFASDVSQHAVNGDASETNIPEGGSTNAPDLIVRATLHGDPGVALGFQAEFRAAGTPFSDYTHFNAWYSTGDTTTFFLPAVPVGAYHWRYRVVTMENEETPWTEFGAAGNTDFIVTTPPPSPVISNLAQDVVIGGVPETISEGGTIFDKRVKLSAFINHDQGLKFEVELKQLSLPFDGLKTKTSGVFYEGPAFVYYDLLDPAAGQYHKYHWRARLVDAANPALVSAWQEFGAAGNEDFRRWGPPKFDLYQDAVSGATATAIAEGAGSTQRRVRLSAIVVAGRAYKLEQELKKQPLAFDGLKTKIGNALAVGRSYSYTDLLVVPVGQTHAYHWRGRLIDAITSLPATDWKEFGAAGNTDITRQDP